jgi:hypothetical protein
LFSTDPQKNYLELRLTAEDDLGLASQAVSIDLRPRTVDLRFVPNPSNLKIKANGKTYKGPRTLRSWVGYDLNVAAPAGWRRAHVGVQVLVGRGAPRTR